MTDQEKTKKQLINELAAIRQRLRECEANAMGNARSFDELQNAKEAVKAADQAQSAFLSHAGHELKTPLTAIIGFAKIVRKRFEEVIFPTIELEAESPLDEKTQKILQQVDRNLTIIISEAERLTDLINNVIDMAKIEAGRVEWRMQPLALSEVLEQAMATTAALFHKQALAVIKEIPADLPQIRGDRERLTQVVVNLLANAATFTDQGSVTCRARRVGSEIMVSIIDTGIGISEFDQAHIFEKFKQIGNDLTGKPAGSGLGLSLCKQIVERHGGRIWVESRPGQGSTFSFTVPIEATMTRPL